MEKGSQLSRLKQEKQNLEQAALEHKSNLKQQEKEKEVKERTMKQGMNETANAEVIKLQDRYTDRISHLEKENKSLEQELKSLSSNETRLKKEIESKIRESKLSETRLMKDISDLEEKVRFNFYKPKIKDLNQKYRVNLESCIQKVFKLSEKSQLDNLSLKTLKLHIDQIISHINNSVNDTRTINVLLNSLI